MSQRSFSRRRRGGHRFRPSGGLSANVQRAERAASDARAEAVGEKSSKESVFDRSRHESEIQRSENLAAGLPADAPAISNAPEPREPRKRDFREPDLAIPAEVKEEETAHPQAPGKEQPPQGFVDTIKGVATTVIKRVQKFISRPKRFTRKSSSTPNPSKPASPCWKRASWRNSPSNAPVTNASSE